MPVGLRSRVPMKITSSMRAPRRLLADCSPKTQEMASEMLDLPQPLGPTMAATPSPWNFSSVRSQKDLKPRICSFFSLSKTHSFNPIPRSTQWRDTKPKFTCGWSRAKGVSLRTLVTDNVPAKVLPVKHPAPIYCATIVADTAYRSGDAASSCTKPDSSIVLGGEEVVENRELKP